MLLFTFYSKVVNHGTLFWHFFTNFHTQIDFAKYLLTVFCSCGEKKLRLDVNEDSTDIFWKFQHIYQEHEIFSPHDFRFHILIIIENPSVCLCYFSILTEDMNRSLYFFVSIVHTLVWSTVNKWNLS